MTTTDYKQETTFSVLRRCGQL